MTNPRSGRSSNSSSNNNTSSSKPGHDTDSLSCYSRSAAPPRCPSRKVLGRSTPDPPNLCDSRLPSAGESALPGLQGFGHSY